ncbi:MAG: response regulator [Bacteroidales bacterium]|jgi:signal transduction histidine kinase/ActR/RegA family two-component response regulator|nr:response regulator [Bacteroidales bacterium]
MNFFQNISIKNKIIGIILLTSSVTLIIGFTIIGINDINSLKKNLLANAILNTQLVGDYSVASLTFDDNEGAEEILAKLESLPDFISGAIYDRNGILFASYKRTNDIFIPPLYDDPDNLTRTKYTFESGTLTIEDPINYQEYKYGIIITKVDSSLLTEKIKEYIIVILGVFAGMIILSFILARRFQKPISQPILELAQLTRKISKEGNYNVKIERKSNDEIGVLYEDFNNMLQQILNREAARDQAEKNLLKAKMKAEESDQLKSAFLANMSHEIRTPMNAILGFTELLTMPDTAISPAEKQNYIKLIHHSGNNLLQLIDDIIDISKIEAGQLKIIPKECDVNQTLMDIYESYQEIKKQKGKEHIDLSVNLAEKNQQVITQTDPLRLIQIISNLIDNALKFTEEGFITFGYEIQKPDLLLFYVKDTGIGMDEKKKEFIFERFRKIEDSKTKLYRGAGLGLAICKSLVELLGGKIWVESYRGSGSGFYFTIPYHKVKNPRNKKGTSLKDTNYQWKDKKILIAEDEPNNYFYIEEVLKRTHTKIIRANNGKEAIRIFKENPQIDLIIMDIKMPEMDGYEATTQIKKINKHIPIIAQSAYAMPGDIEKGYLMGINEYITKPVNPKKLLTILNKYLNSRVS